MSKTHPWYIFLYKLKRIHNNKKIGFISSFPEYVMFWTLLKLNCLDKIVLDFHVHSQRNLVETQKGETLFFFYKK